MDKAPALREIRASLSLASSHLSVTSAPIAARAVPAAGLPFAAPPRGMPVTGAPPGMKAPRLGDPAAAPRVSVPLADLNELSVPTARPLASDAAPIAEAASLVARALASFDAVPVH